MLISSLCRIVWKILACLFVDYKSLSIVSVVELESIAEITIESRDYREM